MSPPGAQMSGDQRGPSQSGRASGRISPRVTLTVRRAWRRENARGTAMRHRGRHGSGVPHTVPCLRSTVLHNLLNDQCYFAFFSHHPLRRAQSCYVTLLHSKHWANVTLEPSSHSFYFSMTGNTCRVRRVALSCGVSLRRRLAARESREQITSTPMPSRRARALGGSSPEHARSAGAACTWWVL